ncbi:early growth response protein 1 [Paragonimus westermani]|uniref:Early growth response protein 1 n=1 Tax=Paragonimus westermani TaxID=34504 RepID=A0A5J4NNI7_9TREM|nr:early growth response protein 1 [Paragonimus westermani]
MTKFHTDFAMGLTDLKTVFNDIQTGHTPTNQPDITFRDFSLLENLDTPTPLDSSEVETFFIYPPADNPDISENKQLQYCKPESSSEEVLPPLCKYTDSFSLQQSQVHSSFNYCGISPNAPQSKVTNCTPPLMVPAKPMFKPEPYPMCTRPSHLPLICARRSHPGLPENQLVTFVSQSISQTTPAIPPEQCAINTNSNTMTYQPMIQSCENKIMGTTTSIDVHYTTHPIIESIVRRNVTNQQPYSHVLDHKPTEDNHGQSKSKPLEKAFACQFPNCSKRFARIDELKRHQRTHSDVRQFVCDVCGKGFTRSDHLMTHRRTHTGERPYPCEHCDRRFARSDERNRHMKVHFRDKTRCMRKTARLTRRVKFTPGGCVPSSEKTTVPWLDSISIQS